MTSRPATTPPPARAEPAAPPYRRALVVANPTAGRGKAEPAARALVAGLEALGVPAELHMTARAGDGTRRVAERDRATDLVVSIGGDGTLGEVLSGLDDLAVPVGILPFGTANVLRLDLGIPGDVEGALRVIAGGRTTELDVADANGRLSFLITGVGPDAMVVKALADHRQGAITKLSYLPATLRTLAGYRRPRLRVTLDGERLEGEYAQVLASNLVHYGGLMRLRAERVLADGQFEVYLFRKGSRASLIGYGLRGFTTGLPGGSCEMHRAHRVLVESDEPVPYHVDGDPGGVTPLDLEVTDRRFRILVP